MCGPAIFMLKPDSQMSDANFVTASEELDLCCGLSRMKLGSWEIDIGFVYHRLPEDWKDLDDAFKRSRPSWNEFGLHIWHDKTDEGYMLEIRFSRNHGARVSYSHLPAYWFTESCNCDECKSLRKKPRTKNRSK